MRFAVLRILGGFLLGVIAAGLLRALLGDGTVPWGAAAGLEYVLAGLGQWAWAYAKIAWPFALAAGLATEFVGLRQWWVQAALGIVVALVALAAQQLGGFIDVSNFTSVRGFNELVTIGIVAGTGYWLGGGRWAGIAPVAGVMVGSTAVGQAALQRRGPRCWPCLLTGLAAGLIPLFLLGSWIVGAEKATERISVATEATANSALQKAGFTWAKFRIDNHIGHIEGQAPNSSIREAAYRAVEIAINPAIGLPGIVYTLENNMTTPDGVAPRPQPPPAPAPPAALPAATLPPGVTAADVAGSLREMAQGESKKRVEDAVRRALATNAIAREAEQKRLAVALEQAALEKAAATTKAAELKAKAEADTKAKRDADLAAAKKAADDKRSVDAELKAKADADQRLKAEADAKRTATPAPPAVVSGPPAVSPPAVALGPGPPAPVTPTQPSVTTAPQVLACTTALATTLAIERIEFATAAAKILSTSEDLLDRVATAAKQCDGALVTIAGHTDRVGAAGYNLALSQRRADAVRSALIARGVPSQRLVARGYGFARAVSAEVSDDARARNRRIEFEVVPADQTSAPTSLASAPVDLVACRADITNLTAVGAIAFEVSSTAITADSGPLLQRLTDIMRRCVPLSLTVGGHTDQTGDPVANVALSRRRAEAVRTALVRLGVPQERVTAIGFGAARLVDTGDTPEAHARNRRIEITPQP